jgi:S-formylglutathione hydrolase FrmB
VREGRINPSWEGTARRARAGAALAAALVVAAALALAGAPARAQAGGLTLVASQQLDPRLVELTFHTAALQNGTHVRVLLPDGYASSGGRRYPVLYLLHGSIDDYRSWTDKGDAEHLTAGLPLIVVMPDAGSGGFYSDWYNSGAGGPPAWETYHVRELIPWIDAHYRTTASRAGRATAGLSMGGFGAMTYPARHPDLFVAAASFSGAVNTNDFQPTGEPDESSFDGSQPYATWGPRQTEEVRWRGHNPWDLAENLRGLHLTLRTGNGQPGGPYGGGDPVEAYVHQASTDLHNQLSQLGIAHVWDDYGPGGHAWPYWQRDLKETLPDIMATFAHPPAPPSPFTFTAIEPTYDVYGWHVAIDRPPLEFSRLEGASRHGFTVAGSGSATVVTPSLFRPGATYPVTIAGREGRTTADGQGRLHLGLALGPGNPAQQYTPAAQALGTQVFRVSVQIGAAPPLAGPGPPAARSRPPRHARHRRRHHRRHRPSRDRR